MFDILRFKQSVEDDKSRIAMIETVTVDTKTLANVGTSRERYQYADHLNSCSIEVDHQADIISFEEYYAYGGTSYHSVKSDSEVSQKRYRYNGKEKDDETGFYYYGARYYASWMCRWVSCDPAGVEGSGLNMYWFCSDNPVSRVDLDGMSDEGFPNPELFSLGQDFKITPEIEKGIERSISRQEKINTQISTLPEDLKRFDSTATRLIDFENDKLVGWKKNNASDPDQGYSVFDTKGNLTEWNGGKGLESRWEDLLVIGAVEEKLTEGIFRGVGKLFNPLLRKMKGRFNATALKAVDNIVADASNTLNITPKSLSQGSPNTHVYLGINDGNPTYVGITKNISKRQSQHGDRFDYLKQITKEPLTRRQARAIEQVLKETNPNFTNKINSISPKREWYNDAINWGQNWLKHKQ